MVFVTRFVGAATLFAAAMAVPMPKPDSAIGNEVAVSAPNGSPMSDTAEASQTGNASMSSSSSQPQMTDKPQYGGSDGSKDYNSKSYSAPAHGSGNSNWGGSGYDNCVQQCMASYSAPAYAYTPTPASGSEGSKGTGATHTVVVAPTMGVLRYVPFSMNASIGDTILFKWGANNHTVTKSSSLTPCNKSSVEPFASGTQNQAFEFTQVVNSSDPVWYYCGTPGHCQKGMFGVINPPNAWGSNTSVGMMAGEMAKNDSDMAAMWSNMNKMTQGNDKAANWGSGINMKDMPDWSQKYMVENVMYTRNFLAANKDVLKDDGTIDLSGPAPLMFPKDMSQALNAAASSAPASSASSTAAPSSTSAASASASPAAAASKNGASSLASPKALIGFMAVAATLFAL